MRFTITDGVGVVAGLEHIPEDHAAFTSAVRWEKTPGTLGVGESTWGSFALRDTKRVERYKVTRTE